MEEQANIPALGIVCFNMWISKVYAPLVLGVSQEGDQTFGGDQHVLERFLEKYCNARQYQTVPQTDTGR